MHLDAKAIANALGGSRSGAGFVARCPSHPDARPSLSITERDGRLLVSHGCEPRAVIAALRSRGLWPGGSHEPGKLERPVQRPSPARRSISEGERSAHALRRWNEAENPRGTLAERYLESREIALEDDLAGRVLRFHRHCRFGEDEAGNPIFHPCLILLFRDIHDDEPKGIHRIAIAPDGRGRLAKKMLGLVGGCAIKLDADENVTHGLGVAEGPETALAVRASGWRPMWALGSAEAIKAFPVLNGIELLTVFADHDENGTGRKAARECVNRWHAAGREAVGTMPHGKGCDWADEWGCGDEARRAPGYFPHLRRADPARRLARTQWRQGAESNRAGRRRARRMGRRRRRLGHCAARLAARQRLLPLFHQLFLAAGGVGKTARPHCATALARDRTRADRRACFPALPRVDRVARGRPRRAAPACPGGDAALRHQPRRAERLAVSGGAEPQCRQADGARQEGAARSIGGPRRQAA